MDGEMQFAVVGTGYGFINTTVTPEYQQACEGGWVQQQALPRTPLICIVWVLILAWIFLGVAMGADVFMGGIEMITSKEVTKTIVTRSGKTKTFHMRFWNETVANLTLMALGSSAPEILINVLEVLLDNFYAGALGPSTIVGSAAFNLMVITAVCVAAIPEGETRSIKNLNVFLITASFSVIAYVWLLIIVAVWTPDVITILEGVITCVMLLLLIVLAYMADTYASGGKVHSVKLRRGSLESSEGAQNEAWLVAKQEGVFEGKDSHDINAEEMADILRDIAPAKTKAEYRRGFMRGLPGHVFVGSAAKSQKLKIQPAAKGGSAPGAAPAEGDKSLGVAASVQPMQQQSFRAVCSPPGTSPSTTGVDPASRFPSSKKSPPKGVSVVVPRHRQPALSIPPQGMLRWVEETVSVVESVGVYILRVERVGGSEGAISVNFKTKDQQAVGGQDYLTTSGTLTFAAGDAGPKEVPITIVDDDELERDETFTVVLSDLTGGGIFDVDTDGGIEEAICTVTIVNDDARATRFAKALQILRMDIDSLHLNQEGWADQVREAVTLPGGSGVFGTMMFGLSLPWRLMFSLVPPPSLGGGWPCFATALLFIGFQVLLISDFANQMGCQIGLHPAITAITAVALGTSLPDLFASKQAAVGDKTADNSIGNVTGSNSVNVFFGLGFPWTLSAIAWSVKGADDTWRAKFADLPHVLRDFPQGAFVVRSKGLGFSVMVFCVCALLSIMAILMRRPAELGGGKASKYATAAFLVALWFVYVFLSVLAAYNLIPTF